MGQIQKKYVCLLLTLMLLSSVNMKSQSITYNTTLPTCATCCNGSFTMTVLYTTSFAFYSTPTLAVTSWSVNVLTFDNVCAGTYSIHITGSELYGDYDDILIIPLTTLVEREGSIKSDLKLFPNPAKDYVQIEQNTPLSEKFRFQLHDINGKEIENRIMHGSSELILNTSTFEQGVYFVSIVSYENIVQRQKLLIIR